ncbi:MAG TPA: Smr/MutS family protein [Thiobacillaceae bacterium]|nr:Smr/MutS family protein [Thiobacillaceae bacterium]HNU64970.1 Smr/MutS family protein [Thiobacillaceae bacterium]
MVFRQAMVDVTPLTPHGRNPSYPSRPLPLPRFLLRDEQEALAASLEDPIQWDVDTEFEADVSFLRPGLSRQTLRRLRRGEWPPRLELDLHGHTRAQAKGELVAFLRDCKRRGIRCVRIIHGKGMRSKNREPVLKAHVRHWLMQRDEVLAFVQARPADGGSGAVVVLLRTGGQ